MSRRLRIRQPPQVKDPNLNRWLQDLAAQINQFPNFSISSTTNGPNSLITGDSGTFLFDFGSSATTLWFKRHSDGSTSGWSAVGFA